MRLRHFPREPAQRVSHLFLFRPRVALSHGRRRRGDARCEFVTRRRPFRHSRFARFAAAAEITIIDGWYTELLALNGFPRTYDREPETVSYGKKYEFSDSFPHRRRRPDGKVNDYNTMFLILFSVFRTIIVSVT